MEKSNYRTLVLIALMLIVVAVRVFAPLSPDFKLIANFTGIGAIALFGGTYFKRWINALLLPVLVLFASDLGLALTMGENYGFYEGWYYTYIAFILMVLVGKFIVRKVTIQSISSSVLLGVFIHWIVSDYGVWLGSTYYAQTLGGFWTCLVAALPYELNFLYGTLAYSAILFGAFESLQVKFPALSVKSVKIKA